MKKQKFMRGDLVHVAKELGPMMDHFEKDFDAIIIGSYSDQFGGNNIEDYTVMNAESGGTISWYYESQLTFIKHVGEVEIQRLKSKLADREERESNLKWIFDNWKTIRDNPSGFTMTRLMKMVGITEPYGNHGEYYVYCHNALLTHRLLDKYLTDHDIEGINMILVKLNQPQVHL